MATFYDVVNNAAQKTPNDQELGRKIRRMLQVIEESRNTVTAGPEVPETKARMLRSKLRKESQ